LELGIEVDDAVEIAEQTNLTASWSAAVLHSR
jgi:hypothetical protein